MVRIEKVRDMGNRDGKALWAVQDEHGRMFLVLVDDVHASSRSFWAWPERLTPYA